MDPGRDRVKERKVRRRGSERSDNHTSVSWTWPLCKISLIHSSSLEVPNSFSSWDFEAPSSMPCAPCLLFEEMCQQSLPWKVVFNVQIIIESAKDKPRDCHATCFSTTIARVLDSKSPQKVGESDTAANPKKKGQEWKKRQDVLVCDKDLEAGHDLCQWDCRVGLPVLEDRGVVNKDNVVVFFALVVHFGLGSVSSRHDGFGRICLLWMI